MVIFKRASQEKAAKASARKVSFTEKADDVHHIDDRYDNVDDIWYNDEDESVFRERDTEMAKLLVNMDPNAVEFKLSEDSPRGLEYSQPENTKITMERRKNSRAAVIATQELFQRQNRDGSESIARAYRLCCEIAKKDAVVLASRDAQFVTDHVRVEQNRRSLLEKERSARPSLLGRSGARRSLQ